MYYIVPTSYSVAITMCVDTVYIATTVNLRTIPELPSIVDSFTGLVNFTSTYIDGCVVSSYVCT